MFWLLYATIPLVGLTGLALNILGLPGLWLMVLWHLIFGWLVGWETVGWPSVLAVTGLALLAEAVEFVAGAAGSKTAGGSKRSVVGAVVGGIVGGIVFTPLIPIPVVGTIVGACAGAFAGAAVLEASKGDTVEDEVAYLRRVGRVGWGAFKGRLWGIVLKTIVGVAMLATMLWTAL